MGVVLSRKLIFHIFLKKKSVIINLSLPLPLSLSLKKKKEN